MASRKAVTVALAGSVLGADPTGVPLFEQPVRLRNARPQPVRRQAAHREYTLFRTMHVTGDPDGDGVAVILAPPIDQTASGSRGPVATQPPEEWSGYGGEGAGRLTASLRAVKAEKQLAPRRFSP